MTAALYLLCTSAQSGGSGEGLAPLVEFYSKLPKGPAPARASSGIKARYFEGANASGKPLVFTILAIFGLGYTIDYNSAPFLLFWKLYILMNLPFFSYVPVSSVAGLLQCT